jgi:hypothetical protein
MARRNNFLASLGLSDEDAAEVANKISSATTSLRKKVGEVDKKYQENLKFYGMTQEEFESSFPENSPIHDQPTSEGYAQSLQYRVDELQQAYERGNITPEQWSQLVTASREESGPLWARRLQNAGKMLSKDPAAVQEQYGTDIYTKVNEYLTPAQSSVISGLQGVSQGINDMSLENIAKDPLGTITEPWEAGGEAMSSGPLGDQPLVGQMADVMANPQNALAAAALVGAGTGQFGTGGAEAGAGGGLPPVVDMSTPYGSPGFDAVGAGAAGAATAAGAGAAAGGGVGAGTTAAIAGSSLVSGILGSEAAKDTAEASKEARQAATAEQRREFDLMWDATQPYRDVGGEAITTLGERTTPYTEELPVFEFDPSKMAENPAYQFVYDEAMRGAQGQAAAMGKRNSGNVLAELQRRGAGIASQEYGNEFQRQLQKFGTDYGRATDIYGREIDFRNQLANLAGIGQTGVAQGGAAGTNMANMLTNIFTTDAQNQANASTMGYGAWNQAIQGGLQNYIAAGGRF